MYRILGDFAGCIRGVRYIAARFCFALLYGAAPQGLEPFLCLVHFFRSWVQGCRGVGTLVFSFLVFLWFGFAGARFSVVEPILMGVANAQDQDVLLPRRVEHDM